MDADPHNEHSETWFGSGLRAHLGIEPESRDVPGEAADQAADLVVAAPDEIAQLAERERELREIASGLAERERRLAEDEARVAAARAELEEHTRALAHAEPGVSVRELIRDRAERETERLWRTIDDALDATLDDGRPDFHARLAAIKLLLGEAYGDKPAAEALRERGSAPEDELAQRRAERFQ